MSILYDITEASQVAEYDAEVFILASGSDDRAIAMLDKLKETPNSITKVLLLKYDAFDINLLKTAFPSADIAIIDVSGDSVSFLLNLQDNEEILKFRKMLIDVTSIRIPEMFVLLKSLKLLNENVCLRIAYSTPIEYEFEAEPFTSYHSYFGNLKTIDLVGFGGISEDMSHTQMIIFLGFEGVLSAKVSEDVRYDKLTVVNNLPSFFEKYKDISVINNFDLLARRHERIRYVPANNPFETFNFLADQLADDEPACVAPLSTKPVALGVCLYALAHHNLRVVYPAADEYKHHRANSVHNTYLYGVKLDEI